MMALCQRWRKQTQNNERFSKNVPDNRNQKAKVNMGKLSSLYCNRFISSAWYLSAHPLLRLSICVFLSLSSLFLFVRVKSDASYTLTAPVCRSEPTVWFISGWILPLFLIVAAEVHLRSSIRLCWNLCCFLSN